MDIINYTEKNPLPLNLRASILSDCSVSFDMGFIPHVHGNPEEAGQFRRWLGPAWRTSSNYFACNNCSTHQDWVRLCTSPSHIREWTNPFIVCARDFIRAGRCSLSAMGQNNHACFTGIKHKEELALSLRWKISIQLWPAAISPHSSNWT